MPLDVVKTQMQINPGKYRNPVHAIGSIYQTSGFRALYFGMPPFMLQTAGKAAIRFTAFSKVKVQLMSTFGEENVERYNVLANLLCGLIAGSFEAALWTTPTERLKVLRQADIGGSGAHKGMFGSAVAIVQTGGVSSLFVGIVPTVIRQASSVGFRFMFYDTVKNAITSVNGKKEGTFTFMLAGGCVGGISVAMNNPVDVIKNIAQAGKDKGTMNIARKIYAENGTAGFFRGVTARVPRVFCGQAITFAVYEQVAKVLLKV